MKLILALLFAATVAIGLEPIGGEIINFDPNGAVTVPLTKSTGATALSLRGDGL